MTRERDAVNQIKVLFPQIKQFVSQCTESGSETGLLFLTFFPEHFNQKQIMTRFKKKNEMYKLSSNFTDSEPAELPYTDAVCLGGL